MVARNLLQDVLALPVAERLEFFEQLRQNLMSDPQVDPLTDDEKRLLDEGIAEVEADPQGGVPWDEVEAQILAQLRDRK
ncbi:MAG TPA: addiction module protein [Tepidisphaeraceae bacterium]|nr:addiction module protein [Tepidisphaeraceae bacterium]